MEQGCQSHSTQSRSFRRRSSKPISWLGTEKKPVLSTAFIKEDDGDDDDDDENLNSVHHAWTCSAGCCVGRVQTVPRVCKKAAAATRKAGYDAAAAAAPAEKQSATDDQRDYVAAWRVDRALQLAADVSNFCASAIQIGLYTARQKKRNQFSFVCIFFDAWQKLGSFFRT